LTAARADFGTAKNFSLAPALELREIQFVRVFTAAPRFAKRNTLELLRCGTPVARSVQGYGSRVTLPKK